jgi:undecaprenyl-diphosphatase
MAPLALDAAAFRIADRVRRPALDRAANAVTKLGLIAVVGPAVLAGAALLDRRAQPARAGALVTGAALAWSTAWIAKTAVDRPRPADSFVSTSGASYPSAHSANSIGWPALALAVGVLIPTRRYRLAAVAAGSSTAALVGLSRIYLRAHYASDVLAGQALALVTYSVAALTWSVRARGRSAAAS